MHHDLKISIGQCSDKGRKDVNQDFHGALMPGELLLDSKGIAVVIADGISSSNVSQVASETAVKTFLNDYYCTSDTWSVKTSAQRVIAAINSWLHAQSQRGHYSHDLDRGYVCTFSALIIKASTAHVFHIGDCRVYRVTGNSFEQLTNDHRTIISSQESYLGRALGINDQVEIDYYAVSIDKGDVFILTTDGVHEFVSARFLMQKIDDAADLDSAASLIVGRALEQGSDDNLTVQIVRMEAKPERQADEVIELALPRPPILEAPSLFDGYTIVREIHGSNRSHIYLATDPDSANPVAIKILSTDLRDDEAYLRRLMMEEWIARRIDSPHVLKAIPQSRPRNYLYTVMEYVEGQTLTQWMIDNPLPELSIVRGIVEQIAKGLRAFHRLEMLHQDLRPDNILIDRAGTVKIIDFGSTRVAGVVEGGSSLDDKVILGTIQYTAPEYFIGAAVSARSDLFSLGVVAYQLLTGKLPYGTEIARAGSRLDLAKLSYKSASLNHPRIPDWVDGALRKALQPRAQNRYDALSEFVYDLRYPNPSFLRSSRSAFIERNPLLFWKSLSLALAIVIVVMLAIHHGL